MQDRGVAGGSPSSSWYAATDPSGAVTVRVDAAARAVRVELAPRWRALTGSAGVGAGAEAALAGALLARLTAWTAQWPQHPLPIVPPSTTRGGQGAAQLVAAALRVRRDVAEFRDRLAALHAAPTAVSSPCGRVRVVVTTGRVGSVAVDQEWARREGGVALAAALAAALTAALRSGDALTAQALTGCPDAADLLAGLRAAGAAGAGTGSS